MGYILNIPGWYPNRNDLFTGDFVQRHAQSTALYEKVIVLYLVKDPSVSHEWVDVRRSVDGRLIEYIVYYPAGGPWERGISLLRYLSLGARMVRRIRKEHGEPMLMHVNVVWKAGLLALRLKRKYGWKYLLTEHWTGYTTDNPEGLHTKSLLVKRLYRGVYRGAELFLPVSRDLERQVEGWFPGIPYEVVYNVVNTELFYPVPATAGRRKKCIHVSTMNYQKNIEGILRVLEQLCTTREDVDITLVGPYTPVTRQALAGKGLLDKRVFLTGEIPYAEVASLMRGADFLLLFSRYENLPCVIPEALCCGLPVIATRVGGIPEIVDNGNGILVDSEKEDQLLQALHTMLDGYAVYDKTLIARRAEQQFSYPAIGRQLDGIYRRYLSDKQDGPI